MDLIQTKAWFRIVCRLNFPLDFSSEIAGPLIFKYGVNDKCKTGGQQDPGYKKYKKVRSKLQHH